MDYLRGTLALIILAFLTFCIVLQVKRCRKTYYNMFNLHIITATGSLFSIGGGCGLLLNLLFSPEFTTNDKVTNIFLIYACLGFVIFGLIMLVFNIYNGYKGLGSVFYATVNLFVQAIIGVLCLLTFGIGFMVILTFYKKWLDGLD